MKTKSIYTAKADFVCSIFLFFFLFVYSISIAQPPPPGCPQLIDQQQTAAGSATTGSDQWQSFTVGMAGDLTLIEFHTNGFSAGSQPFVYTIYTGTGTGGTVLYSNSSSFNTPTANYYPMPIPPGVIPVVPGNILTCRVQISGSYNQMGVNSSNAYAGGTYFSSDYGSPPWDLKFRTYVSGTTFPPASITPGGSTTFCQGGNVNLTANAGAFTYQWYNGATPIGGATAMTFPAAAPGPHAVLVTSTATNCWRPSNTINVIVNPLPNASSLGATICANTSSTLTMTPSGGTPSYTYNWFTAPTGGTLLGSAISYNTGALATPGTYIYYPEVTDVNGCKSTRPAVNVTVNPLPTINVSGGPVACFGGTASLTATGATTYTWQPGSLAGASQTLPAGSYTVAGTLGTCSGNTLFSLTQPPGPLIAGFSGGTTVCSGVPLNLTLNGSGGTPPYTFQWIGSNNPNTTGESTASMSTGIINDNINNPTASAQVITYTITATDANACTATQTVNVTVNPLPAMTSGASGVICSGVGLNFNLSATIGSSFSWLASDNINTSGESLGAVVNPIITNTITSSSSVPQTISYTITPTSGSGCSGSNQTLTITVNPAPVISSASGVGICSGGSQLYSITSLPAGGSYTWIAADNPNITGESLVLQVTGLINNTLVSSSSVPVNVSYTITPTSLAGCLGAPFVMTTSVNPKPVMTSANSSSICSGATVTIPLTSDISSNYTWLAADNINTTGESTLSQNTTTLSNTLNSSSLIPENVSYTVTPTATVGGCTGNGQVVTVTVNPLPAMASAGGAVICSGNNVAVPLTSNIASNYSWLAANNANTTGESTTSQTTTTINDNIVSSLTVATSVSYTVTPTSLLGCVGSPQVVNILVNPAPVMTSSNTGTICSGALFNLPLTSSVASTYQWIAADNINTSGESLTTQTTNTINNAITSSSSVAQNVSYTVTPTSGAGCVGPPQTLNVSVNPAPVMTSINAATICSGSNINIPLTSSVASNYQWIAADNANTSGESTITQTTTTLNNNITSSTLVTELVAYTITPTSLLGCVGAIQNVNITVNPIPAMTSSTGGIICSGATINLPLTSNIVSTYSWIATDNINTSGESTGSQSTSSINNTITSISNIAEFVSYTVTPTSGAGCTGIPQFVTVNVNPAPIMTNANTGTVCSGTSISFPLLSSVASTYQWIAMDNANTSGESLTNQTTTSIGDNIASTTTVVENISYTVTPTSVSGCTGVPQTINISVNPAPVMTSVNSGIICSGTAANINLSSNIASTFNWIATDNTNTTGESTTNQTTTSISDNITSLSAVSEIVSYTVTPTSGAGCVGVPQVVNVTVNSITPPPTVANVAICDGNTATLTATAPGGTYDWFAVSSGGTSLSTGASFISPALSVTTTYYVQANVSGCISARSPVVVTVNPNPGFIINAPLTICSGQNLNLSVGSLTGGSIFNYNWNGPGAFGSILPNPIRNTILISHGGSYSLDISNEFGCLTSNSVNVTVLASPTAIITGGPTVICANETATLSGSASLANGDVIASYQWLIANTPIAGATSVSYATGTPGNYFLEVINTNGCADTSIVSPLIVNAIPTSVINGATAFCSGGTVSLSGMASAPGGSSSFTAFEWMQSGSTVSGATTINEVFSTGGNYQLVATNSDGCKDTSVVFAVTENFPPSNPGVSFSNTTYCEGDSILASIASPVGAHSYSWSVIPASVSISNPSATSTYVGGQAGGTYSLNVTETDLNGCVSNPSVTTLTVNALPIVNVSQPSSDTICYNGSVAVGILNSGMAAYEWTSSYGQTINAAVPTFSFITQLGDIAFYGAVTDVNGCKSLYDTVNVYVANTPTVTAGSNISVCEGNPVTLTGAGSVSNFSWSNGVTDGVPFLPLTTQTYTVTGTDNFSCINTATVLVTVNTSPVVNAGADAAICAGNAFTLNAAGNAVSYSWNNGVSDGTPFVPTATLSYVLTGLGSNGCTKNDTVILTVNALPNVGVSATSSFVCAGSSLTLNGTGANSYSWSGGITDNVSFIPTTTLTYTVTGTDLNLCSNTATQLVTVNAPPTITANASSNNICPGTPITLNAFGGATYVWSSGQTQASFSFVPTVSASYTVTGTDINLCSGTAVVSVSLLPQPATPLASANVSAVCTGTSVILSSSSVADNNWFNAGTSVSLGSLQSFSHTETTAGTYSYGLFVFPSGGCSSDTSYVSVTFNSCLTSLNSEFEFITANSSVSNNVLNNDGNPAGYTANTSPVISPVNGTFNISPSGAYSYTPTNGFSGFDLVVVQICDLLSNCLNDTIYIVVSPLANNDFGTVSGLIPNAQLTGNVLLNDAGSGISNAVSLITNVSSGTLTLAANGDFTYTPTPGFCGLDSFRYQVCDANALCSFAYCIIDVNCEVNIQTHTGFSPNNDGKNDLWVIENIAFAQNKVSIYDRWGNEVWVGDNYDNTSVVWNGRNKNDEELTAGTYFYFIEVKDKTPIRGWVEITK